MNIKQKKSDQKNKELMDTQEWYFLERHVFHKPVYYHPHWHDFMELLFVRKGFLQITLRNTMLTIKEKELFVVMPGELHSTYCGDELIEYDKIQFDLNVFQNLIHDSKELSMIYTYLFNYWAPKHFLCGCEVMKKAKILPMLNNIFMEFDKKELGYSVSIKTDLVRIFLWFVRRWYMELQPVLRKKSFFTNFKIQPVFDFIQKNYNKDISTAEIAALMAISEPYFCSLFKKMTGYSFRKYVQNFRITESIKLLFTTDNNINEIASLVGYPNANFFVRAFKEQTGLPPLQYKKKYVESLAEPEY
jgi:AraC-like DNA-binding protein